MYPVLDRKILFSSMVLIGIIWITFFPSLIGGFIWDDIEYIELNPLLETTGGLVDIWLKPAKSPQYYPITFTSFWIENQIWGKNPLGYRLINVILHTMNSLLIWGMLARLGLRHGWLIALVWGIHPMRMESVAWISERKDVLSAFLCLTSLHTWLSFSKSRNWWFYAISLGLFTLGLLAKTSIAPLPLILVLFEGWFRGFSIKRPAYHLIPFFMISICLGLLTIHFEKNSLDVADVIQLSLLDRISQSGKAIWFYWGKSLIPHPILAIYPLWEPHYWGIALLFLFFLLTYLLVRRTHLLGKEIGSGLLWYLVLILPSLGWFSLAYHRYSYVANHFSYLAGLGILMVLLNTVEKCMNYFGLKAGIQNTLYGLVILVLGLLSWQQAFLFQSSQTLFEYNLRWNPEAWGVHTNLGAIYLRERGNLSEAERHFQKALEINPHNPQSHYNLGVVLANTGKTNDAKEAYQQAIKLEPDYAEAHNNLGTLYFQEKNYDQAFHHFSEAARIKPEEPQFHTNKFEAWKMDRRIDE